MCHSVCVSFSVCLSFCLCLSVSGCLCVPPPPFSLCLTLQDEQETREANVYPMCGNSVAVAVRQPAQTSFSFYDARCGGCRLSSPGSRINTDGWKILTKCVTRQGRQTFAQARASCAITNEHRSSTFCGCDLFSLSLSLSLSLCARRDERLVLLKTVALGENLTKDGVARISAFADARLDAVLNRTQGL